MKYATALEFYDRFWAPAAQAVSNLEARGVLFDRERAAEARAKADSDLQELLTKWDELSGGVNPRAPGQLQALFYTARRFPVPPVMGTLKAVKRARKGDLPTSEAALDWLLKRAKKPENIELLTTLMSYRKLDQLRRFLVSLPEFVCEDGRIRGSFSADKSDEDDSGGTNTGRLASRNPNLQNIPAARADRYGIRSCFVAPPGRKLLVADYVALELYIMAEWMIRIQRDSSLLDALLSGDVYAAVAKRTWPDRLAGIEAADIKAHSSPEVQAARAEAKVIVLSSNYCKSVGGLALQLGCPEDVAQAHADAYARAFPGIPAMQQWAADYARKYGGVRTLAGRFRQLPDIHDPREWVAAKAARQAINTIVQGSAAEVVFGAMINLDRGGFDVNLQIHDEVNSEVADDSRLREYETAMTVPYGISLTVPLRVSMVLVNDWGSAK